jgi:hypothetical protein
MEAPMTTDARKAALERKHAALEEKLQSLHTHPSADPAEERQIKREKLRVKDEIARLAS